MPLLPGLCSITLRRLPAEEVLRVAERGGLRAIEWGSDIHCPPGTDADALARSCRTAGINCPSYGTYFFAGQSDPQELPALFDTAASLGARVVRVWAQLGVTPDSPGEDRQRVLDGLLHVVNEAEAHGLHVGMEYHGGTLSHTLASTLQTLDAVDAPLLSYWQPRPDPDADASCAELDALASRLGHLHVFSWTGEQPDRIPMDSRASYWKSVLAAAVSVPDPQEISRSAYLEYVPDDDPERAVTEATFLRRTLDALVP